MLEKTLKGISIFAVVLGVLAIMGGDGDYYALVGGLLYLTQGAVALIYIGERKK